MQKKPAETPVVKAPVVTKEKKQAKAYVNWYVVGANGEKAFGSSRGFALYDDPTYPLTPAEKALIALADGTPDGVATMNAVFRVVLTKDKDKPIDISGIQLIK